ncbi:MAG: sigma factor-like helix-turn-helix DNA-binding protein [Mediterraneibacter faecis]
MLREQKKVVGIEGLLWDREIQKEKRKQKKRLQHTPGAATINEDFLELLDQMEQQYRVVLILYYVEEMSIREISQILRK